MFGRLQPGHQAKDGEEPPRTQRSHPLPHHLLPPPHEHSPPRPLPNPKDYPELQPSSYRHHPYPMTRCASLNQPRPTPTFHNSHSDPSSISRLPPLPLHGSRYPNQGYWTPRDRSPDRSAISGGSAFGQISLLADVATREAEGNTSQQPRSAERMERPDMSRWYTERGRVNGYSNGHSDAYPQPPPPMAASVRPEVPSRHPLSGLSLDKYAPYVPGKFEQDVRKVLSTPTFTHSAPRSSYTGLISPPSSQPSSQPSQPSQPLQPSHSSQHAHLSQTPRPPHVSQPIPANHISSIPPQWPPHQSQVNGRADPEKGRAWTVSLDPAHRQRRIDTSPVHVTQSRAPSPSRQSEPIHRPPTPSSQPSQPKKSKQDDQAPLNAMTSSADRPNDKSLPQENTFRRDRHLDGSDFGSESDDDASSSIGMSTLSTSPHQEYRSIQNGRINTRAHSSSLSSAASAPVKASEPMIKASASPSIICLRRRAKSESKVNIDQGEPKRVKRGGMRRKKQNAVAAKRHRDKKKMIAEQMEVELEKFKLELEKKDETIRSMAEELDTLKRKYEAEG